VTPIATATNTAGPPIPVGSGAVPITITPDGKTAYVGNEGHLFGPGTVTPIATATNTAGPPIPVGIGPSHIVITPDGATAYVANSGSGTVTPIATATNTAGPPIPVGLGFFAIAIAPDGKTAYVANGGSGTVTPIATATNTAGPAIRVGKIPSNIAITADGRTAYVTNYGSDTVTPIATASNTAGLPIPVGGNPFAIAIAFVPAAPLPTGPIVSGDRSSACIDDNDSTANDAKIVMWACNDSTAQSWTIEADGTIQVNGKCMDIYRDEQKTRPPSSCGPVPAAQTRSGSHATAPWSTRCRASASTIRGSIPLMTPSLSSTPATAAATSNGNCPDRHRPQAVAQTAHGN
jgi:YVTN family beta-propeller protein